MNMLATIVPKSDQINADDLIGKTLTITITEVAIKPGTEQPVTIFYEGGRPFRPCKSMCRVMVAAWGPDANAYVGRSMTLYRDPKVKWGGLEVGGIRISNMTDLPNGALTMALTETKGNKKPFVVKPLKIEPPQRPEQYLNDSIPDMDAAPPPPEDKQAAAVARLRVRIDACQDIDALNEIVGDRKIHDWRTKLALSRKELNDEISAMFQAAFQRIEAADAPADDEVSA